MATDPIRRGDDGSHGKISPGQHAVCRCWATEPALTGRWRNQGRTPPPMAPRRPGRVAASLRGGGVEQEKNVDQPRSAPTWATALVASASRS